MGLERERDLGLGVLVGGHPGPSHSRLVWACPIPGFLDFGEKLKQKSWGAKKAIFSEFLWPLETGDGSANLGSTILSAWSGALWRPLPGPWVSKTYDVRNLQNCPRRSFL